MLFWAVDNPAPANYLLISGDRDFSNALHQLRMRKYNILLAQPLKLKASHALVAAAKSVWLWTNLVAGGSPFPRGESTQPANVNNILNSELSRNPISDPSPSTHPQFPGNGCFSSGNQKFNSDKDADSKFRGKYVRKNPNLPMITRASSAPVEIQEIKNDAYSLPPAPAKEFKKAPHEFFGASEPVMSSSKTSLNILPGEPNNSGNTTCVFTENAPNHYPQPYFVLPHNMAVPNPRNNWPHPVPLGPDVSRFSSAPTPIMPNINKLSISQDSNYSQNSSIFCEHFEFGNLPIPNGQPKGHSLQSSQPFLPDAPSNMCPSSFQFPPSSSTTTAVVVSSISANGIPRTQGYLQPSNFVQGDIGVVLLALTSLKVEKIMPTEANIRDCIHFGDPRHRNIDIRKALDNAIEQNMVVMLNLGVVPLYVGKYERLWKCVNPLDGNLNQYPKSMWERIQKFLASADGHPVIMTSQCR